ncbi:MAG TPA: hopanoid biosynthesis-associated protein HpnK [Steroidobacteraceae bacterium]|nr:hopanoid biosynthesis-associated protein HpnK [Steroidobacteraceae bacterium]
MKLLIVTADDFGLHPAVNGAVERAAREGVLTAASLMVGAPAAADAVRRARDLPRLAVGLHLVLADGCSVLPPSRIPALVDAQGRFGNNMVRDGVRFFALPGVRRQLEAEIRAQFQAFADTGLPLDHVNAHKHFHLHPTLLEMLLRIGGEFGVSAVRLPREPAWAARRSGGAIAGATVAGLLSPWLAIMRRRLRAARIAHNDHVFGMSDSGAMDEARLLQILARLPEGVTEIYLHPALESGAAIAASMAGYRHAQELAALLSPRVRAAIVACGAATGGFRQISPPREERHAA